MRVSSLRQLRHFLAAAAAGSLHAAAKGQSLTQSALTRSIQQLEADLGVTLFERHARGVTLSRYGRALHLRAERIDAECALIERELSELAGGLSGELIVAAGSVWSSVLLPPVISSLNAEHPNAQVTVVRSSGSAFLEQFATQGVDLALGALDPVLASGAYQVDRFVHEPLLEIASAFFAHRTHPLHRDGGTDLARVTTYPQAVFRSDPTLWTRVELHFAGHGVALPRVAFRTDSVSALLETLRCSPFVACLPSPLAALARTFDVLPLEQLDSPWTFRSGALYPAAKRGYPLLEEFVERIRTQVAGG